jgi:hypothetical protein
MFCLLIKYQQRYSIFILYAIHLNILVLLTVSSTIMFNAESEVFGFLNYFRGAW